MARVAQLHDNIDKTKYYALRREAIIGRSAEVDIYFGSKRVSRRHAKVAAPAGSDAYYVEDICTRGVFVNFKRIQGRHPLQPGDRICILRFRNIHPIDLDRMTDKDLRECCDDPRNESVKAIVDLTFQYVEVPDAPADSQKDDQPKGLLAKLKFLFGK